MPRHRPWVEVALNGPWGPALQPSAPIRVDAIVAEGIAAAKAGAAIVHVHAYDEDLGRQKDDWQIYARIIEGIRSRTDVIVYPTIPLAGSGLGSFEPTVASDRYRHVEELARRGLIEWTVCDPGSVNFARFDRLASSDPGFLYMNPGEHIREGLRVAADYGVHPSFAIYEPGFARLGAAMAAAIPRLKSAIYRLMFSDEFAWGFPPRLYAVEAYLKLLAEAAPDAPWMVAGLGVELAPIIDETLALGGHLRVGLEDAPLGIERSNQELVEEIVGRVRAEGLDPADASEVRAALSRSGSGVASASPLTIENR